MFKKACLSLSEGSSPVLSLAEGKAAALPGLRSHFGGVGLTRGAYSQYMSTAKGRERRWPVCRSLGEGWRLFSTFPY